VEDTFIRLNVVNVITITLCALLGYMLLVGSGMLLKKVQPQGGNS
jgi:hypothetical protein